MRLKPPLTISLKGEDEQRANVNHSDRITELQSLPFSRAKIITAIALEDAVEHRINHGLGRAPTWVGVSVVRGALNAGRIVETRDTRDRTETIYLTATGHGATITIDLVVI
jgi:hypothetical protein